MTNLLTFIFGSISRSLAAKLIIALVSLIIIGGGISWYALIHTGRENLINEAVKDAASYSELVTKSVRYGMVTFNRDAIQQTIDDLGSSQDVTRISLFDSKGKIFYSSRHDEIGRQVDTSARACLGCHRGPEKPLEILNGEHQWTTYQGKEGHNLLTFIAPIYNEPLCSRAACHVHSPDQRVLGLLEADFSLATVDKNIKAQTLNITGYAFVLMGIVSVVLYAVLRKFVLKPVTTLSDAMGSVANGDLGLTVTPFPDDQALFDHRLSTLDSISSITSARPDRGTTTSAGTRLGPSLLTIIILNRLSHSCRAISSLKSSAPHSLIIPGRTPITASRSFFRKESDTI